MAKYSFDVSGSQLIISLVPVLDDVQPTSMSYLAPSFKIGVGKINAYEYGQPKQSFLFTEIGEIDGVEPTDLQDAFDKLTTATANFNGGGTAPYKVYTALLTQSGTDAPVATVLENTLGQNVIWTRVDIGDYKGTLPDVDVNKIFVSISDKMEETVNFVKIRGVIGEELRLQTVFLDSGSLATADSLMTNTPIEIRVYN